MKKLIFTAMLIVTASFTAASAFAQKTETADSTALKAFKTKIENFTKKETDLRNDTINGKNTAYYNALANLYNKMVADYESQPETIKKEFNSIDELYYNQACYNSQARRIKKALEAFEKSVNSSCPDSYQHAMQDTDLDNIRNTKSFKKSMEILRSKTDYLHLLKECGSYSPDTVKHSRFTYPSPNDRRLVQLRKKYNLDSIAGSGDEISKIKNLLYWAHDIVRHDGSSSPFYPRTAENIIETCKKENRGVNCRMMAIMLHECYLAMGFKARYVTCLPKVMINDCHVIDVVYSNTLDKWIWVDPTFCAYVTDENGTMLSIQEVRERLRDGRELNLNPDANWNHKSRQTKEEYLFSYMAKNLYHLECVLNTNVNVENGKTRNRYIDLCPTGYKPDTESGLVTTDDAYFWQSPYSAEK